MWKVVVGAVDCMREAQAGIATASCSKSASVGRIKVVLCSGCMNCFFISSFPVAESIPSISGLLAS